MQCPACKEPLITLEHNGFEVDYCVNCLGIWLDAGELELLFGDAAACAAFLSLGSPARARGEKPRRCPRCGVKMTKESTESTPPVLFDHCPRGDGLWFDQGELETVLKHGAALGEQNAVTAWLEEIFKADSA